MLKYAAFLALYYLWKYILQKQATEHNHGIGINSITSKLLHEEQKQPSRGALRERCSENMQQIYRRITRSDFNRVTKATLLKSHFSMGVLLQICCIFSEHLLLGTPIVRRGYYPPPFQIIPFSWVPPFLKNL